MEPSRRPTKEGEIGFDYITENGVTYLVTYAAEDPSYGSEWSEGLKWVEVSREPTTAAILPQIDVIADPANTQSAGSAGGLSAGINGGLPAGIAGPPPSFQSSVGFALSNLSRDAKQDLCDKYLSLDKTPAIYGPDSNGIYHEQGFGLVSYSPLLNAQGGRAPVVTQFVGDLSVNPQNQITPIVGPGYTWDNSTNQWSSVSSNPNRPVPNVSPPSLPTWANAGGNVSVGYVVFHTHPDPVSASGPYAGGSPPSTADYDGLVRQNANAGVVFDGGRNTIYYYGKVNGENQYSTMSFADLRNSLGCK